MKIKVTGQEDVDWINSAHSRGQWQAVVNRVMNPVCHKRQSFFE
jgi:hypothetical protein